MIIERFKEGEIPTYSLHGELECSYYPYYSSVRDFYKIGDADPKTCMQYALNSNAEGLVAMSYGDAVRKMNEYEYIEVSINSNLLDINNCIVSYGTSDDINHYAKIVNGVVTAKLNAREEYVMHPNYNCYASSKHAVIRFFAYDP